MKTEASEGENRHPNPSRKSVRWPLSEMGSPVGSEHLNLGQVVAAHPEYQSMMKIRSPHGLRFQPSFHVSSHIPLMDMVSDNTQVQKSTNMNMPALDGLPADSFLRPGFFKDRILQSICMLVKEVKDMTTEKECKVMAESYYNQKKLFGCSEIESE